MTEETRPRSSEETRVRGASGNPEARGTGSDERAGTSPETRTPPQIRITLAVIGHDNFDVNIPEGSTVQQVLDAHLPEGVSPSKCDVRLNNRLVEGDRNPALRPDDLVCVVPKIEGGRK